MRIARFAAMAGAAALVLLGGTACDNGAPAATSGGGGAAATSELNGIQSTLDSVSSDMAGDGSP